MEAGIIAPNRGMGVDREDGGQEKLVKQNKTGLFFDHFQKNTGVGNRRKFKKRGKDIYG